jgi:hypothetical protein
MFLRDEMWDRIRDQFSEAEKVKLRATVVGVSICPKACTIAEEKLEPELHEKLKTAIERENGK